MIKITGRSQILPCRSSNRTVLRSAALAVTRSHPAVHPYPDVPQICRGRRKDDPFEVFVIRFPFLASGQIP